MSRKIGLVLLLALAAASCTSKKQAKPLTAEERQALELQAAIDEVESRRGAKVDEVVAETPPPVSVVEPAPVPETPPAEEQPPVPAALSRAIYEPDPSVVGGTVAVVNGEIITKEEVLADVRPQLVEVDRDASLTDVGRAVQRKEVIGAALMRRVERSLALQEARRVISPDEATRIEQNVNQLVSDSIRRAGTSTQLEGLLAEKGKTLQDEKQAALDNRLIRALLIREVDAHVDVTPAEMRQYYDTHAKDYARVKQVRVRQIFLDRSQYSSIEEAVTKARDLLNQIRRGGDFAKLAEQHSDGPYAKSGGLWDFVTEGSGTFPPEVERAAFRMAPRQVSEPVLTKLGVHLVQVEDVRPARQVPFQEVQEDIGTKLREQERRRLYRDFIRKLWAKSAVDIRWR